MESNGNPLATPDNPGQDVVSAGQQQDVSVKRSFLSRKLLVRIFVILVVVAITTAIFVFRDEVERFETYGYLGAFLISLITTATIILPVPGIIVVFELGDSLNPVLLGLAAGAGSALGELTGYMAGYSGQVVFENSRVYMKLEAWMKRRGSIVIFVLSLVPNPIFDLAGASAGVLRYALWKFLLICFLGKTLRYIIIAFIGAWLIEWLEEHYIFAILIVVGIFGVLFLSQRLYSRYIS